MMHNVLMIRKHINRYKLVLPIIFILFFAIVFTLFTSDEDWEADSGFGNMIYFSTVTYSTVGFGDVSPKSTRAKILVVLEILVALGFVMSLC